jgi:hypothetical protein
VDSLRVVAVDVLAQQASQVVLAEHDDVVQKLPTYTSDKALGRSVLPRGLERCALGSDAQSLGGLRDLR